MTFIAIGDALEDILTTVKNAWGSKLAQVFNYSVAVADASGYPYACIVIRDAKEEATDNVSNQTLYRFTIRACDVDTDKALLEAKMRGLADDVLAELRKRANAYFWGIVDRVYPFNVTFGWDTANQMPLRYFEIDVTVLKHFDI